MTPHTRAIFQVWARWTTGLSMVLLSLAPSACASASAAAAPPDVPEPFVVPDPNQGDWPSEPGAQREPWLAAPPSAGAQLDVESAAGVERAAAEQGTLADGAAANAVAPESQAPVAIINEAGQPEVLAAASEQDVQAPALGESEEEFEDRDPSALSDFDPYLRDYGSWVEHPHYGTVWVPEGRVVGSRFTPYVTRGHWSLTTGGDWIWVSDYPFGWVVFHYGRWIWTPDYGWAWIAGRRYAHAWVHFRTFSSSYAYVGWGPLPPRYIWRGGFAVAIGRYYPVPYVFCPFDYAFNPSVASYIVWERHRARRLIHRSRPYGRHVHHTHAVASPPISHIPPRARPSGRVLPNPKAIAMARRAATTSRAIRPVDQRTLPPGVRQSPVTRQRTPTMNSAQGWQRSERRTLPRTQQPRRIERRALPPSAPSALERRRSVRPIAPIVGRDRARTDRPSQAPRSQKLPQRSVPQPRRVIQQRATQQRAAQQRAAQQRAAQQRAKQQRPASPPQAKPRVQQKRVEQRVPQRRVQPDRRSDQTRRRIEQHRSPNSRPMPRRDAVRQAPNRGRTTAPPSGRRRR